jgi:hypothetical protein
MKRTTVKLKKPKTSKRFDVVFPANVDLECFVDNENRIFAKHPNYSNIYIYVKINECKNPKI